MFECHVPGISRQICNFLPVLKFECRLKKDDQYVVIFRWSFKIDHLGICDCSIFIEDMAIVF